MVRSLLAGLILLAAVYPRAEAQTAALDSSVAITDPGVLRTLEGRGMGLATFLDLTGVTPTVSANNVVSKLPALAKVKEALTREIRNYKATHEGTDIGTAVGKRLFDHHYLESDRARFALVGIALRMDRAYVDPDTCGELRLIYRLAYNVSLTDARNPSAPPTPVFSRLPMTVNLVMRARPQGSTLTCADIARRWTTTNLTGLKNGPIADLIMGEAGALSADLRARTQILRLETNMQIVRWPAAVRPDFGGHAEYMLKVFPYDAASGVFNEGTLENQIDRAKLLKNKALMAEFKAYLLAPATLKALDAGTIVIPEKFLAFSAFNASPGGTARSFNQPVYGLFSDVEIETALRKAQDQRLVNILSPAGFRRRGNDITCTGCHQTRTVAGFHFMGRDPMMKYPGNSVYVPASPHFFQELPRRRQIVEDFASGREPDFSRGFSSRPQEFRSSELRGTGLMDGWGAHCSASKDPSFASWTCAAGLECRVLHNQKGEPAIGVCAPAGRQEIGDPLESGTIAASGFGSDRYTRIELRELPRPQELYVASPQSAVAGSKTGGFPGGMIRTKTCENLPNEAVCGSLPAAKNGFNDCVQKSKNFAACLTEFSAGVGLRGCDRFNPCRDDYICAESQVEGKGACVPPYFLFQFRVDGHPISTAK